MRIRKCLCYLIAFTISFQTFYFCPSVSAKQEESGESEKATLNLLNKYSSNEPEEIIHDIESKMRTGQPVSNSELIDLACCYMVDRKYLAAKSLILVALSRAANLQDKNRLNYLLTSCLALDNNYKEAATVANEFQILNPNSMGTAALRYEYWKRAGDPLETIVAEKHLSALDPNYGGEPVAVGAIVVAIFLTYAYVAIATKVMIDRKHEINRLNRVLETSRTAGS